MHYVLERREAQKKTYLPVMSRDNVLNFMAKDLMLNCEYYFRVKAVNKIGSGEYLELRNPVRTEEQKRKCNYLIRNRFYMYSYFSLCLFMFIIHLCFICVLTLCYKISQNIPTHQLRLKHPIPPQIPSRLPGWHQHMMVDVQSQATSLRRLKKMVTDLRDVFLTWYLVSPTQSPV